MIQNISKDYISEIQVIHFYDVETKYEKFDEILKYAYEVEEHNIFFIELKKNIQAYIPFKKFEGDSKRIKNYLMNADTGISGIYKVGSETIAHTYSLLTKLKPLSVFSIDRRFDSIIMKNIVETVGNIYYGIKQDNAYRKGVKIYILTGHGDYVHNNLEEKLLMENFKLEKGILNNELKIIHKPEFYKY